MMMKEYNSLKGQHCSKIYRQNKILSAGVTTQSTHAYENYELSSILFVDYLFIMIMKKNVGPN